MGGKDIANFLAVPYPFVKMQKGNAKLTESKR